MECLHNAVKGLSMRSRRIICSMLRNNANKEGLISDLGITLEQYCVLVSLLDSSFKWSGSYKTNYCRDFAMFIIKIVGVDYLRLSADFCLLMILYKCIVHRIIPTWTSIDLYILCWLCVFHRMQSIVAKYTSSALKWRQWRFNTVGFWRYPICSQSRVWPIWSTTTLFYQLYPPIVCNLRQW